MTIAEKIESILSKSSWIRKMFEQGAQLKAVHGEKNVYDFSLGNPNIPPPDNFRTILMDLVSRSKAGAHAYMPNAGYPFVREAVAAYLSEEQETAMTGNEVVMTCGAAGALNVILKVLLNPDEEVIVPAPYFVEYHFYADNHGGVLKPVQTNPDFSLDIHAISQAINEKTKAVLINSPNNPTGQIYSKDSLAELGRCLTQKGKGLGKTLYLLSDEPYRKIVYDNIQVPSIFTCYPDSIIASSYSKDISIPGERIGFLAVNPRAAHRENLLAGMALANRILGFVNAPALMQRAIAVLQGTHVNLSEYTRKRDLLCDGLASCGYDFITPSGAFYLFPKTPIPDDVVFVQSLQEEKILTVPGSGFGAPGYFRISYCVDDDTIVRAIPGFKRVLELYR